MDTERKELGDFIGNESVVQNAPVLDNDVNAKALAQIITGNPCGNLGARLLYLKNLSTDKKIGVNIEIKWVYQSRQMSETRVYYLFPQQQIELGCPIPGPTSQRFDFSIAAAWFI